MISKIEKLYKSYLFKKSGIVFILRIIGLALAFWAMSLIGNTFGAEVYGRFSLAMVVLQLITLIVTFGIPLALMKLVASKDNFDFGKPKNRVIKKSFLYTIVFALIGSIVIYLSKKQIALVLFKDTYFEKYILLISLLIIPAALHKVISEFLRGIGNLKTYALSMYILPYTFFLLAFYMFSKSSFFEEYFLFAFYLLGITAITLVLMIKKASAVLHKTKVSFPTNKLFQLAFPMMFSAAFIFVSSWTDVFMLGAMVSKADLGIYNAAFKLATLALVIINAVNTVLGPKIADYYSNNKLTLIKKEVVKATKLITLATFPMVVILIVFRKYALSFFGAEFVKGEYVLTVVALGLLFNAMSGSVGLVLNMTKHQKTLRNFTILSAIINILLNYMLIRKFGVIGAAIASLISTIFLNTLCVMFIKKKFGFYGFFGL